MGPTACVAAYLAPRGVRLSRDIADPREGPYRGVQPFKYLVDEAYSSKPLTLGYCRRCPGGYHLV